MKFKNDVVDECFTDDFEVEAMELQEACDFLGVPFNRASQYDEFDDGDLDELINNVLGLD